MPKRLKLFVITFILAGLGAFFIWYLASGQVIHAVMLGIVGGTVVGILISLGLPFIRNRKKRKNQRNNS